MLTERQRDVFLYIHRCLAKNKLAPTNEEICREFNIKSKSQVHGILKALVNRGILKKYPHYSRGLEIIRVPDYLLDELHRELASF